MTLLPPDAQHVVDCTIASARLSRRESAVVRQELESHFLDGLDAGLTCKELIASYGDPAVAATLIGRAKRRSRGGARTTLMLATSVAALGYIVAVARLSTAPSPQDGLTLDREAQEVIDRVTDARSRLQSPRGVWEGYAIAADLRRRHSLWAEWSSLMLLDQVVSVADSILASPERAALLDSVRVLAAHESLLPRDEVIRAFIPRIVDRLYGENGRIDRAGLRLVQRTKGVVFPSVGARLLEPLYFARGASRDEVHRMISQIVSVRFARAEHAGRRLLARTGAT